jgi:hypothetical protein
VPPEFGAPQPTVRFNADKCAKGIKLSADGRTATLTEAGAKNNIVLGAWPSEAAADGSFEVTFTIGSGSHYYGIGQSDLSPNGYHYGRCGMVWSVNGRVETFLPARKQLEEWKAMSQAKTGDLLTLIYQPGGSETSTGSLHGRLNGGDAVLLYTGLAHNLVPALALDGVGASVSIGGDDLIKVCDRSPDRRRASGCCCDSRL